MKLRNPLGSLAVLTVCGCTLLTLSALSAQAQKVWINSDQVTGIVEQSTVVGGKYRLSHTNFDMSLDNGKGTTVISGQNTFISQNLSTNSALNGVEYLFSLSHEANKGFTLTMTKTGGGTSTLTWRSDVLINSSTASNSIQGVSPTGRQFNALSIFAVANRNSTPAASMSFYDFSFTSGLTVADNDGLGGTVTFANGGTGLKQWIYSDIDLSQYNWTLSGKVKGQRDAASGGDETVKFVVDGKKIIASVPVPEPAFFQMAALLGLGGLSYHRLRRRGWK